MTAALLDLLIALAAYRAWRLLALDSLFDRPRHAFYRRFPPDEKWVEYKVIAGSAAERRLPTPAELAKMKTTQPSKLGVLVDCPWCAGWWLCGAVVAATTHWVSVPLPVLVWGASSTVVGFLGAKLDG